MLVRLYITDLILTIIFDRTDLANTTIFGTKFGHEDGHADSCLKTIY